MEWSRVELSRVSPPMSNDEELVVGVVLMYRI